MLQKSLFQNRNFYLLMGYQLSNGIADKLFQFCIPWLVYDLTSSSSQMVMAFGMSMTPYLLFSIIGGAFIDFYNRRKILLICSLLSGTTLLGFSLFFLDPSIKVELSAIYGLSFLLGTYNALDQPAFDASIIEYFKKDELVSVNSAVEVILSFCSTVGPLLAGVLITLAGSKIAVIAISFIYIISFGLIKLSKPIQESSRNGKFDDIGELIHENCQLMKEGFAYVFKPGCPLILIAIITFFSNIFTSPQGTLVVFMARESFKLDAENFAFLISITSLVAILGIAIFSKKLQGRDTFFITIAMLIIESIASIGIGLSRMSFFFFGFYLVNIICSSVYCIFVRTYRQSVVPYPLAGRVTGIIRCISYASIGLGAMLSSVLLKFISAGSFFILSGILVIPIALAVYRLQAKLYPLQVKN